MEIQERGFPNLQLEERGDAPLVRNLWEHESSSYGAKPPRCGAHLSMTVLVP